MSWAKEQIEEMWENYAESVVDPDPGPSSIHGDDEKGYSFILPDRQGNALLITVEEIRRS
jgi:hypothetical protein